MAPGLRRGRPLRLRGGGHRGGLPGRRPGRFTAEVPDYAGLQVFEANAPITDDLRGRGRPRRRRALRPQLSALLAHRHAAHLQGRQLVVRGGHRHQGPHGRAQPADQLGPRPRPRRRLRQVARGGPGLVDHPQPLLGRADPGVEERRPALPPHRRLRQPRRARARLRRAARPTCTARPSTSSSGRTPTTRPGSRRCAGSPTSSTAGSSPARCPSPRCTTPSRTPSGSSRTSRPTSSSSTSARPGAGSTRCTCWRRRCSTAGRFDTASSTASCSATTGARCPSASATTPTPTWSSTRGAPTPCAGSCSRRRSCAARTSSSTPRASRTSGRQVLNPIWNTWYFLSLYANVDGMRGRCRTDATGRARPLHPGQDGRAGRRRHRAHGRLRPLRRVRRHHRVPRRPDQLVRPPQPRPLLAGAGDGLGRRPSTDKADAYDTLSTVLIDAVPVSAPLLPLLTEAVYQGLTGERSVHLTDWPDPDELPADPELVDAMDLVREVCSAAHSIRKANGLRARLPLRRLTVATADPERLAPSWSSSRTRSTSKRSSSPTTSATWPSTCSPSCPRALGPRLGPSHPTGHRRGPGRATGSLDDGGVEVGGVDPRAGRVRARPAPPRRRRRRAHPARRRRRGHPRHRRSTDELEAEGRARDVVRLVQGRVETPACTSRTASPWSSRHPRAGAEPSRHTGTTWRSRPWPSS